MNTSTGLGCSNRPASRRDSIFRVLWAVEVAIALTPAILSGCGRDLPPATVEGTLRLNGEPLDNCLVTFLPESGQEGQEPHSRGLTDREGAYRLRFDSQQEGAAAGWHRVTVRDLSVSSGTRRRDHGTVDAEISDNAPPPPVRRSRLPEWYLSPESTPLRQEIKPGHQVIDLDIK